MAKTFLEKVKDKTNEVNAIRSAVEKEIASAEENIGQIAVKKAEALRSQDRNTYLSLCDEMDHLREYINSNREYLDGLSAKMPFEEVYSAWKAEGTEFTKVIEKQTGKLEKVLSDLVDVYRSMESAREIYNMTTGEYSACVDPDSYPEGHTASSFQLKTVAEIPKLGELYRFLLAQGLITSSGQRA